MVTAKVDQAKDTAAAYKLSSINKNRCFTLLVVDDQNTEWWGSGGSWLSLISHNPGPSTSGGGGSTLTGTSGWSRWSSRTWRWAPPPSPGSALASSPSNLAPRTPSRTDRLLSHPQLIINPHLSNLKPDFLLIRQNLRDAGENYKNLLLGFRYGGVPSVNSIESIYNFQVKKKYTMVWQQLSEIRADTETDGQD